MMGGDDGPRVAAAGLTGLVLLAIAVIFAALLSVAVPSRIGTWLRDQIQFLGALVALEEFLREVIAAMMPRIRRYIRRLAPLIPRVRRYAGRILVVTVGTAVAWTALALHSGYAPVPSPPDRKQVQEPLPSIPGIPPLGTPTPAEVSAVILECCTTMIRPAPACWELDHDAGLLGYRTRTDRPECATRTFRLSVTPPRDAERVTLRIAIAADRQALTGAHVHAAGWPGGAVTTTPLGARPALVDLPVTGGEVEIVLAGPPRTLSVGFDVRRADPGRHRAVPER